MRTVILTILILNITVIAAFASESIESADYSDNLLNVQTTGDSERVTVCLKSLYSDKVLYFNQFDDLQKGERALSLLVNENRDDYTYYMLLLSGDNFSEPMKFIISPKYTYIPGDVDENGYVDARDATLTMQYFLNNSFPFTKGQFLASDVDADGKITENDYHLIFEKALRANKTLPDIS